MTWRSACNHLKVVLCLIPALVLCSVLFAQNAIVTENALPGNPISEWGVPDFRDNRIAGFATKMSLNRGETVRFKISSQSAASFTLKIYRIGYYGGNGARLQGNLGTFPGKVQPAGISDAVTGLLDCSNWTQSASWFIPTNAVSGMYIAKLERSGGGSNHIVFIVRNDASNSDLYFQIPDATWQAYNAYGGSSLYDGTTGFPAGHAVKVSYNRPFFIYNASFRTDGRGSDWYMNAEYPIIRWLERNGYNLTYTCSNDVARNGSRLLNHKVFITSGHDEYWSKEQRNNVEAARNAGIHIAFFTGNEVYWKTRWESFDGSESRTLVCYKEGLLGDGTQGERTCGSKCDGSTNEWTGLWRTGGNYDAGKPENALIGQISWVEFPGEINVPAFYKKLRFWRNTSIANLSTGQTAVLGFRTLGYEWDFEQYPDSYPAGRITMSSTTISGATHKLSLYRHSSGALVFGAGTVQWSWGLDGQHLGGTATISAEMQQATVNLFADMGVQPGTLQSGLVTAAQSGDATAPSATITSPANGATFASGATINITGTATDAGGGVVAGVEVSVDGGATWKPATLNAIDGTVSWSFSWSAAGNGTFNIRCRGFDDSGNIGTAGAGINISVGGAAGSSNTIFQVTDVPANPRANDGQAISLGVRFRSSQNGFITGIRYFKGSNTTGVHTGHLWTNTGTQLAQATFANETASGWQQVLFSSPVAITADVTYVASCFSPSGDYASTVNYFTQAVVNGPLRALFDGENGINGVYRYSPTAAFPINGHLSSNYWVDVVFTTNANPDNTPPTVVSVSPLNGATGVSTGTTVVANFSEAMNGSTVTSSTFQLKQGTNVISASRTTTGSQVILTPSSALAASTTYTVTITGGASGVKDLAGNALASNFSWSFTTAASGTVTGISILPQNQVPASPRSNDGVGIALGVRFRSSQNGFITGVRYYKGAGTTGVHTGQLWTNTGTLLAQATFTNETASGWQQVLFSSPVAITAGVTYVASYHSPSGDFAATVNYYTQAVVNGPLRGLADGENGPNGLYRYSATAAFPTNGHLSSNYWADIVFSSQGSDITPPTVTSVSPLNGATGVSTGTTVVANFSEAMNGSTVTSSTFQLKQGTNVISASRTTTGSQVILTPSSALAASTTYTVTITGGASGVKDLAGNALASNFSWSFTTTASGTVTGISILPQNQVPASPRSNDGVGIALGVRFRSSQNGFITGVRYYKGAGTTGVHTGQLWTNTGTLLAQATFTNETASGWQQVLFSSPVAITAGVTYVASYHSPSGDFAATVNYYTQAVVNGPLRGLADGENGPNGLYRYSATAVFPTNGHLSSNYWADVIFSSQGSAISRPTMTSVSRLVVRDTRLLSGEPVAGELEVQVMPNPSRNVFNMIVRSSEQEPITIRIFDISGRLLERHDKVSSGQLVSLGQHWQSGAYIAEVIQGNDRKQVKIVKAK